MHRLNHFNSEINGLHGGFDDVTVVASLRMLGAAEGREPFRFRGTVGVFYFLKPLAQRELESALHTICRKYPRCYGVGKRYQFTRL